MKSIFELTKTTLFFFLVSWKRVCHQKKKKKICTKNNQIITHSQTIFRTNKNRQSINNYEWIETKLKYDQIRLTVCFSRVYGGMPWVAFERMRECEMILLEFNYLFTSGVWFLLHERTRWAIYIFHAQTHIGMLFRVTSERRDMSDRFNIEVYFLFYSVEERTFCRRQATVIRRKKKIEFQARKSIVFEAWTTRQKPINFGAFGKLLCR